MDELESISGENTVNRPPAWQRNEFQQINTDFSDAAVVECYEQRMGAEETETTR
jgi:hypothetical protein